MFRSIGCRIPTALLDEEDRPVEEPEEGHVRDTPTSDMSGALPVQPEMSERESRWAPIRGSEIEPRPNTPQGSTDPLVPPSRPSQLHVSDDIPLSDAGGLLEDDSPTVAGSSLSNPPLSHTATLTTDFASQPPRRGSRAFIPDLGSLLPASPLRRGSSQRRPPSTAQLPRRDSRPAVQREIAPVRSSHPVTHHAHMELKDVGGLLF